MNSRVLNRFLIGLVGLAAVALLVPTLALGAVRPDDRSGPLGIGATSYSTSDDVFSRAVARHMGTSSPLTAIRPDDRAGMLGIGASSYSTSDDVFTRAVARRASMYACMLSRRFSGMARRGVRSRSSWSRQGLKTQRESEGPRSSTRRNSVASAMCKF